MANRTRALLSRIYTFGISRDIVEINPVFGTEPPGQEKRRDRVLTADEIRTFWHALGVEHFGQSGGLAELYGYYRIDEDAILDAAAALCLGMDR